MAYLLVKMFFIILLAAFFGFLLGMWWIRRQFVDVSEEYNRITARAGTDEVVPQWGALQASLGGLQATVDGIAKSIPATASNDATNIETKLSRLDDSIRSIRAPTVDLEPIQRSLAALDTHVQEMAQPTNVDVEPLMERINGVGADVRAIVIPPAPEFDVAPLVTRLTAIEAALKAIDIPEPKETDLSPVTERVEAVEDAVRAIKIPKPPKLDLSPIMSRVDGVESAVREISIPEAQDLDLAPVIERVAAVEEAVRAISIPDSPDLHPVVDRIDTVERAVHAIHIPESKAVDFSAVFARIEALQKAVEAIELPEAPTVDWSTVMTPLNAVRGTVDSVDKAVKAIDIPPSQTVDLAPIEVRLAALESALLNEGGHWSTVSAQLGRLEANLGQLKPPVEKPKADPDAPVLLNSAAYGPPDNLKRISGVGPVLEGLLNRLGVWYFWQVARWSEREVKYVDSQLEVFKGRIIRDEWVRQATQLAQTSDNQPPADHGGGGLGLDAPHAPTPP